MALSLLYANEARYRDLLDEHMNESLHGREKHRQLPCMADPDRARVSTTVHQPQARRRMHLVYPPETEGGETEEVALYVQGFLVDAHLAPIRSSSQLASVPIRTQQTVTLSGLGSTHFSRAILGVKQIHGVFAEHCSFEELLAWTPRDVQGYPALTMSSRYFTTDAGPTPREVMEFPSELDPLNILRNAVPSGLYSADNEVLYFDRRKMANSSSWKHVRAQPTAFKIGQLVEVQLSFTVVPNKKGRYLLVLKLRSICILDRSFQDDMNKTTIEKLSTMQNAIGPRMKRRVGYQDDVEGEAGVQGDLKRMRLGPEDKIADMDESG